MPSLLSPPPVPFPPLLFSFIPSKSPRQSLLLESRLRKEEDDSNISGTQQGNLTLETLSLSSRYCTRSTKPLPIPCFKSNCRSPIKEEVKVLGWVEGNGRLCPIRVAKTFTRADLGEENSIFPCKGVGDVNFVEENGGLPTKAVEHFHRVKAVNILSSGQEVENLSFVNETGVPTKEGVEVVDEDKGNGGIPRKERQKVKNFVEEKGSPPTEEEMGTSDHDRISGTLTVGYLVDRIRNMPVGEHVQILDLYKRGDKPMTNSDFNKLLLALVRDHELESAMTLFSELSCYGLSPDSWSFSIMIRCLCKKNEPDKAKHILDDMMRNGFRPNTITFTVLIHCFCKKGRLQGAFELFEIMGKIGCEPSIRTYNCLINGLCYVGRVEEAFQMLKKIEKSSMKPDIYTFTTVMDGFCKVGRTDEAMELLREAMYLGLKPTVVTFNALFNGFCKEGRPLEGVGLLKEMEGRYCQPDLISYSTLLQGLLKWGEISVALTTYKEMREAGLQVAERVMNTLLRGICRQSLTEEELLKEAEELFERVTEMGYSLSPYTYCLMVQALANRGDISNALTHLLEMERIGHSPRMMTYNVVIRVLCGEGRVDDALLVFVLMIKSNRIPSMFSFNRLLDEFNRRGRFLDACSVYAAALKQGAILRQKPREHFKRGENTSQRLFSTRKITRMLISH